jgi:hypothetical protein
MPTSSTSSSPPPASPSGERWGAFALCLLAACGNHAAAPSAPVVISGASLDAGTGAQGATTMRCVAADARDDDNPYDDARTVAGDDGSFTDHCDPSGNLVSYRCADQPVPCPGGSGHDRRRQPTCLAETGRVVAETIDCDGQCRSGACAVRCPAAFDVLTFLALDSQGNPTFASNADPRHFACTLAYDQDDAFDCAFDQNVGDTMEIAALGLSGSACAGGVWGAISDDRCTYADCRFVYDH